MKCDHIVVPLRCHHVPHVLIAWLNTVWFGYSLHFWTILNGPWVKLAKYFEILFQVCLSRLHVWSFNGLLSAEIYRNSVRGPPVKCPPSHLLQGKKVHLSNRACTQGLAVGQPFEKGDVIMTRSISKKNGNLKPNILWWYGRYGIWWEYNRTIWSTICYVIFSENRESRPINESWYILAGKIMINHFQGEKNSSILTNKIGIKAVRIRFFHVFFFIC